MSLEIDMTSPAGEFRRWLAPAATLLGLSGIGFGVRYGVTSLASRKFAYAVTGSLAVILPPVMVGVDHLVQRERRSKNQLAPYLVAPPLRSDCASWRRGVERAVPQLVEGVEGALLDASGARRGRSFWRDCLEAPCEGTCAGQTLALHELTVSGGHDLSSEELLDHLSWDRVAYFHGAHRLRCSLERLNLPGSAQAVERVRSREERWFESVAGNRHMDVQWPSTASELAETIGENLPEGSEAVVGHFFIFPRDSETNAHLLWFQVRPLARLYDSAEGRGLFEFPPGNLDLLYQGLWSLVDRMHRELFEVRQLFISLLTVSGGGRASRR